jgi:hypothetical protein
MRKHEEVASSGICTQAPVSLSAPNPFLRVPVIWYGLPHHKFCVERVCANLVSQGGPES